MNWRTILMGTGLMLFTALWSIPLAWLLWTGTIVDPRDIFPEWMSKIGILFICPGALLYMGYLVVFDEL